MTPDDAQWRRLLTALADRLTPDPLAGDDWRAAFVATPRHVFVPGFYDEPHTAPRWVGEDDPAWLSGVYDDDSLITQVREHPEVPGVWWPTSSSSRPSLMVRMLNDLEVHDGARVLEIGTGTGYNAALLAARLGDDNVVSIDIDSELVDLARERNAHIGRHPRIVAGDGTAGYSPGAPYDRVIATHSVEQVPYSWIEQTRPGGVILVDVRSVGAPAVGHLARLTVNADGTASGRFDATEPGFFMPTRLDVSTPNRRFAPSRDLRDARTRTSSIGGEILREPGLAFAVWAALPDITFAFGAETLVFTPEGSWATAPPEGARVQVAGARDLWAVVEEVHADWTDAGRPQIQDYAITVTPDGQEIRPG